MTKKRIISAVLLVCMVFSSLFLVSCGGDEKLEAFAEAISSTKPSKVDGTITMETEFGTLAAAYNAAISEDGSFVLNYSYDKFNGIDSADNNDVTDKVEGSVTYKDGAYSDVSLASKIPGEVVAAKIELDEELMTYTVSDDGNVLAATIKAADTKNILGVEYAADVTIVLTKANDRIVSLSLSYTLTEGKVEVVCSYN